MVALNRYPGSDHQSMMAAGVETVGVALVDKADIEGILGGVTVDAGLRARAADPHADSYAAGHRGGGPCRADGARDSGRRADDSRDRQEQLERLYAGATRASAHESPRTRLRASRLRRAGPRTFWTSGPSGPSGPSDLAPSDLAPSHLRTFAPSHLRPLNLVSAPSRRMGYDTAAKILGRRPCRHAIQKSRCTASSTRSSRRSRSSASWPLRRVVRPARRRWRRCSRASR